jgi:hypothetical protein
MIGKDSWINLPVGSNLVDHLNVCGPLDMGYGMLTKGRPMSTSHTPMSSFTTFMRRGQTLSLATRTNIWVSQ